MTGQSTEPALLIDGRNCVYRAVYANSHNGPNRRHDLVVLLRFVHHWITQLKPTAVHIFWDAPRVTLWRHAIYDGYKRRSQDSDQALREKINATQAMAIELLGCLNARQYQRKGMEADDLIYSACRVLRPTQTIIISSDGDFAQIPYAMQHVRWYHPQKNVFKDIPPVSPVLQKALMGDTGDKINGFVGIGPKKSALLAGDLSQLVKFLSDNGRDLFLRNMLLIDLSLCPYLLANDLYVAKVMARPPNYDHKAVINLMAKYKITGLLDEYSQLIPAFRHLTSRSSDGSTRGSNSVGAS